MGEGLKPQESTGRCWCAGECWRSLLPTRSSTMWPFLSRALFPPPTEAWLQRASSDPEAQGWGACSWTEKTPLGPGCGDRKEEEEPWEAENTEEDKKDAGFPLSPLESEDMSECPVPNQVTASWVPVAEHWAEAGQGIQGPCA